MAEGLGRRKSRQVQGGALAADSEEGRLNLGAVGGGIGKDESSAETESKAGGFEGVAAGGDVVHKVGLAERQGFAGAARWCWSDGMGPSACLWRSHWDAMGWVR